MPDVSGTSIKGRQILIPTFSGATAIAALLVDPTQISYRYQGIVSLELVSGSERFQVWAKKIYWQGIVDFTPLGSGAQVELVAYWHYSGLSWRAQYT